MRAGHAFSVSLEMLRKEFDPPLADEFRTVFGKKADTQRNVHRLFAALARCRRHRLLNIERQAVDRGHLAEALGQVVETQECHGRTFPCTVRRTPPVPGASRTRYRFEDRWV